MLGNEQISDYMQGDTISPIFEKFIILINQVVKLHDPIVGKDKKVLENTSVGETRGTGYNFKHKLK